MSDQQRNVEDMTPEELAESERRAKEWRDGIEKIWYSVFPNRFTAQYDVIKFLFAVKNFEERLDQPPVMTEAKHDGS